MSPSRKSPPRSTTSASSSGEVVLYRAPDGSISLDVRLEKESIWLSLDQIALLLGRDKSVTSRHLRNIYASGELSRRATVAKNATVQTEGGRTVTRQIEYFNLDVIISVGYRVNSKRGTQFRIWATGVLRDHLLKGYSVNEKRLTQLKQAIRLVAEIVDRRDLSGDEAKALLRVVGDYSQALDLIDEYDHQRVQVQHVSARKVRPVTMEEVGRIIESLRGRLAASDLFGRAKDAGLPSTLGAVMQTFDRADVYPSLEEKAANLLYLLVKNHPFVDGNKRIGAAVFLWFLEKNHALYRPDGSKRIADNALVAMTLLIAESKPTDKELLARVVVNLINRRNL
ncbi:MAG: virulence protein RhuM/Fic/DOC family protein [candidate division Zixibacteria bacterium]|nr:virulence protein RhuM/Fic/DOC family protein [candidate division Zixibacteria bacterium]